MILMESFQKLMFQSKTFVKIDIFQLTPFWKKSSRFFEEDEQEYRDLSIRNLASFCQSVLQIRCNGQFP